MKRPDWLVVIGIALGLLVLAGTANAAPAQVRVFSRNSYVSASCETVNEVA